MMKHPLSLVLLETKKHANKLLYQRDSIINY